MKKIPGIKILCCFLLISILCTGCAKVKFSGNDSYLIQVDRFQLCASEARLIAMSNQVRFEEYYIPLSGTQFWKHALGDEETFGDYVKDNSIWQELAALTILNAMGDEKEIELTEEEQKKAEEAAKDYYETLTKEEKSYTKASQNSVKTLIQKYVRAEKVIDDVLENTDLEISDNETRVMDIQTIFVKEKSLAEELKQKLDQGEDFLTLSKTYSEDGRHEISVGRGELIPALENGIFSLESGKTSDIITTEQGNYLIKCISDYNEQLSKDNKQNKKAQRIYEAWLSSAEEFMKDRTLELNEKIWNNFNLEYRENVSNSTLFEIMEQHFPEEQGTSMQETSPAEKTTE